MWLRLTGGGILIINLRRSDVRRFIMGIPIPIRRRRFSIWVRSRNCDCLVTWFCYHLIAKPGNKTATVSWPDPYRGTPNWNNTYSRSNEPLPMAIHYGDVIMGAIASQITNLTIVYSTVYSDADQRKHQSSTSLTFVWGIHRGPVNSPHKWPVTRKFFPFDDVIMMSHEAITVRRNRRYLNLTTFVVNSNDSMHRISSFRDWSNALTSNIPTSFGAGILQHQ